MATTISKPLDIMPHILIIEDDSAIAATLRFSLERESWQTTWIERAGLVNKALAQLSELHAVILDVGLPDGDGFGVCQSIRSGTHHAQVPILFLTARDDEIDKVLGLEMGADDYLTKPFSPREIIARIKAIWRREQFTPSAAVVQAATTDGLPQISFSKLTTAPTTTLASTLTATQGLCHTPMTHTWHYHANTYTLSLDNQPLELSKTELAIMLALLDKSSHILSREQLLAHASNHPEHRLSRTIDSHIKTLRQKLSAVCADELIITHRGLGYSLC
ncbi:MAG: response regulator [Moraxella sp.]|nr:response regulator [Moraxella sp.]